MFSNFPIAVVSLSLHKPWRLMCPPQIMIQSNSRPRDRSHLAWRNPPKPRPIQPRRLTRRAIQTRMTQALAPINANYLAFWPIR
ncbi:MAG: hypothetical protein JWM33_3941 [Caulobacteraceae bacterium]|nr:hypothetical protein [Caulobacteraceae bacterium]